MSRGQSYFIAIIRNRTRQNPQFRTLTVESRGVSCTEMAATVSTVMRERHRWQQTLVSDFPSFDFSDPLFFRQLLKSQNNVMFSLWFFRWLCSTYDDYTPDSVSSNLLFGALLDAKAVKAAKSFLDTTGFKPEAKLWEQYVKCLCEQGLLEQGIQVYTSLKQMGIIPCVATCNSVLLACLKARQHHRFWQLHKEMVQSEVDHERFRCLIQALCDGGQVEQSYELLKLGLKQGLDPGHAVYNKLISGFCDIENHACMSEILHTMIAWQHFPDIYTYQQVINGLCKKSKQLEAYHIFNSLKEKGYTPDRVVYTTMIHGFCGMGWLGSARKLWFEMIKKGMRPNEYTYSVMIHGYLKRGEFGLAGVLYGEMFKRGYEETTVSYNTLITGFCSQGKSDEAFEFFKRMSETGVEPDEITYNALVQGFWKENKVERGIQLFKELKALGLKPFGETYATLRQMRNLKIADSVATSLNEILEVA